MTNEGNDIQAALNIIEGLVKLLADPMAAQKLKRLHSITQDLFEREVEEPSNDRGAKRGTCPTCNREYGLKKNGSLRRHGEGKCYTDQQLPAEVIPAIIAIAQLGEEME